MSDAPTRYTSCVYNISHNMCARHTHYHISARRTYCADYCLLYTSDAADDLSV